MIHQAPVRQPCVELNRRIEKRHVHSGSIFVIVLYLQRLGIVATVAAAEHVLAATMTAHSIVLSVGLSDT